MDKFDILSHLVTLTFDVLYIVAQVKTVKPLDGV